MPTKWVPNAITELAIAKLEEQMPDMALVEYGTPEHLAVVRYGTLECCEKRPAKVPVLEKDGKPKLVNGVPELIDGEELVLNMPKLKAWFEAESAFLGYASNAKKMLIEHGSLDKKAKAPTRGYD